MDKPQSPRDTRVWMYRHKEAQIFPSPETVPEDDGWVDSPAKVPDVMSVELESDQEIPSDPTIPIKRGRGRPRKTPA